MVLMKHMWLLKFQDKVIKIEYHHTLSSLVTLATFQVLSTHTGQLLLYWIAHTSECFHAFKKFYKVLLYNAALISHKTELLFFPLCNSHFLTYMILLPLSCLPTTDFVPFFFILNNIHLSRSSLPASTSMKISLIPVSGSDVLTITFHNVSVLL